MREVRRSALLPFTTAQVYALVADVGRYPEFVPWCTSATTVSGSGEEVTVALGLLLGPVSANFTTRNRLAPPEAIEMALVDGPFRTLEGRWSFTAIGEAGTRAELQLRFETSGLIGGIALGPAFEQACNQLVDAFGRRAHEVYGGR